MSGIHCRRIVEVLKNGEVIAVCHGQSEAAAMFSTSPTTIGRVSRGEGKFGKHPEISFRYRDVSDLGEPEEWKPIPHFEYLYEVSSLGRLRNVRTKRILRPKDLLQLCSSGQTIQIRMRRLVAEAFVPGRTPEKNYVRHKDGNSKNNRANNLFWAANAYPCHTVEAWKNGALFLTYPSLGAAARAYFVSPTALRHAIQRTGYIKKIPGVYFRFAPDEEEIPNGNRNRRINRQYPCRQDRQEQEGNQ